MWFPFFEFSFYFCLKLYMCVPRYFRPRFNCPVYRARVKDSPCYHSIWDSSTIITVPTLPNLRIGVSVYGPLSFFWWRITCHFTTRSLTSDCRVLSSKFKLKVWFLKLITILLRCQISDHCHELITNFLNFLLLLISLVLVLALASL